MADILISQKARGELNSIKPPHERERVREKLRDEVAANPDRHLISLTDRDGYRARVGDYRAIIDWDKANSVLRVTKVEKRDTVYDD